MKIRPNRRLQSAVGRMLRLVAASVVMVMVLAACGGETGSDDADADIASAPSESSISEPSAEPSVAEPAVTEPASADSPSASENDSEATQAEAAGELQVAWQGPQERHEVTNAALDVYREQHPGVTLDAQFADESAYWQRLATVAGGGSLPDVFQQHVSYISDYATRDTLYDLHRLPEGVLDTGSIPEPLLQIGEFDGQLFGIPNGLTAHSLHVDSEVLADAGMTVPEWGYTWDDFEVFLEELVTNLPEGMYGSQDFGGHDSPLMNFLRGRDKLLYTPDGQLGASEEDIRDWFTMWQRFREKDLVPPCDVTSASGFGIETAPISQGLAPIEYRAANQLESAASQLGKDLELMSFPSDNGEPPMYAIPTGFWSMSSDAEDPALAGQLINFLINDPAAGEELGLNRGMPPSREVLDSLDLSAEEQEMIDYITRVIEQGGEAEQARPAGAGAFEDVLARAYEGFCFGQLDLDQAVDQFFTEANEALGL